MIWPNIRDNVQAYLHGDGNMVGQAEWVIYRRFMKGQLTPQYSPTRDEAIGGTKFKYIEFLLKMIQQPIGGVFGIIADTHNRQGWIPQKGHIALVEWNMLAANKPPYIKPQEADIIFTIHGGTARRPPSQPYLKDIKLEVVAVGKSAGDYGRPEAWLIHIDDASHKN